MKKQILENSLQQCTVSLISSSRAGTGFFVAPGGWILTCDHVVDLDSNIKVYLFQESRNREFIATVRLKVSIPVDIALLKIEGEVPEHECVFLEQAIPEIGDKLYTFGYPQDYGNTEGSYEGDSVTTEYEGLSFQKGIKIFKLKEGQIEHGFSGSPLLNQRTAKVCGIVSISRNSQLPIGGRATPLEVFFSPENAIQSTDELNLISFILEENKRYHQKIEEESLNFLGRDKAISDINKIVNKSQNKVVIIYAEGGVGKTTVAQKFFDTDSIYNKRIEFIIPDNIPKAEEILDELLERLNELSIGALKRCLEFEGNLNILEQSLRQSNFKIGIFIDNLEYLLDKNGEFIDKKYESLFKIISHPSVKSLALITSRVRLNHKYDSYYSIENYPLDNLSCETWRYFFDNKEILIDDESLEAIYETCNGNAVMMGVLANDIIQVSDKKLKEYWGKYKGTNITQERLIKDQFDRLEHIDKDAYNLLCYLGCYSNQKISERHIIKLSKNVLQTENAEKVLEYRCILRLSLNDYNLHNLFRLEARDRLKQDLEKWRKANKEVANLYSQDLDLNSSKYNRINIDDAFRAFDHYYDAHEFERCHTILIKILEADENIENLRCSENLWRYRDRVIEICVKLIESNGLSELSKALTLIPLGVLYSEIGKIEEAIEKSKNILTIVKNIPLGSDKSDNEKIIFSKLMSYIISARSNRILGNLKLAIQESKKAINLSKKRHSLLDKDKLKPIFWQSLSKYELGNAYLERARLKEGKGRFKEAWLAIFQYFSAGMLAKGKEFIPAIIKTLPLLFELLKRLNINENISDLDKFVDELDVFTTNQQRDDDYTKKFRILFNIAQCFNLINFNWIAYRFLLKAEKYLPRIDIDHLNTAWLNTEIALCLPDRYKQEKYDVALNLEEENNLSLLCGTWVLFSYANYIYNSGKDERAKYEEAMEKYIELEEDLDKTEFESLKMRNYYNICKTWIELDIGMRGSYRNVFYYLQSSRSICQNLNLDFYEERINKLEKDLRRA